ncbi:MAG: ATP-binding cassette domain-containing protein [Oscillibacter sp.]|nr:ATP-binding cassette domain-containing protein [Oscillibacter sp.]
MDGIAAEHIWKAYCGQTVLRDVTFQIPPGGWAALRGPSGAGKTTLLRLFLRLEAPNRGTVTGPDRWSAVFQEDRLLEHLDGLSNLRLALGRAYRADAAAETLDALGLGDAGGKRVRDYSGGMRRRLALGRALLSPSDALALDEPFTGLDDDSRRRCVEAVERLGAGRTILLASHDPRDASDLGARTLDLTELNREPEG